MGVMFCDDLTEPRQKLYWQTFRDRCEIDEWEYACHQAIARETFHKVPLPAQLMEYVQEYRHAQERQRQQEGQCQAQIAYNLKEAERLMLEALPEWKAEQQRLREELAQRAAREQEEQRQSDKEYREWKASLSQEDLRLFCLLNPPREKYVWRGLKLAEEQLRYEPQGDPAEAKRKAREQLRQIMAENKQGEEG